MRMVTLVMALSALASGQNIRQLTCPATPGVNRIIVQVPYSTGVGGQMVSISKCVDLPIDSKIVDISGVLKLVLPTAPPATIAPSRRDQVDKFPLPPDTPAAATSVTFTLSRTPVKDTAIKVFFHSSRPLGDYCDAFQVAANSPKSVTIGPLPDHRPFTPADTITLVYLTEE